MILLLAIVIVAVVAVAMIVVSNQPVEAHIPPDLTERYDNVSRSFSVEGYPQLGELNAPVTLEEYASFACPGCEALHSDSFDAILDRVRAGQVLYTYVPMQTGSIPNAQGAARAALCAGRQGMFWEMHDVLFDWQTRYANTAYSQNRLLAGAEGLGLNTSTLTNCFNSAAISDTLNSAMSEDVTGTPTVQVNGVTIVAERAGGVPSTAEILKAVDDATPNDWGIAQASPADANQLPGTPPGQAEDPEAEAQTAEDAIEEESAESAETEQADGNETAAVAEVDVTEDGSDLEAVDSNEEDAAAAEVTLAEQVDDGEPEQAQVTEASEG